MKRILIALLLFLAWSLSYAKKEPSKIYYGMYVKNILLEERAKEKSNRFMIDGYWWMRYEMPTDTNIANKIEDIEFVNAEVHSNEIEERYTYIDPINHKAYTYITGHVNGDFMFYPSYKYYPLDKLILPITIESKTLTSEQYQLIPDSLSYEASSERVMGIANDIEIPSFRITKARYRNNEKFYETNFGDPKFQRHLKYSRLNFEIILERRSLTFLLKMLIPIVLITLMAYLVFFVPAVQLEVAVGLTVTSLLSCIALQLTLGSDIPVTGYLISSDKIFYLSYTLITFAMIQTVYTFNLQRRKKMKKAHSLEIIARWIYPIVFIVGISTIIINGLMSHI